MQELLKEALSTGKPVVALLMNGRPLALAWEQEHVPAIMECWQLGIEMGHAVADVLFGAYNPSGKLSCTFPAVTGQCPRYYNHPSTGRPVKELKAFQKVQLAPGEAKKVLLSVEKRDLGFYNDEMEYLLEDGVFIFYVGGNSKDCMEQEIVLRF